MWASVFWNFPRFICTSFNMMFQNISMKIKYNFVIRARIPTYYIQKPRTSSRISKKLNSTLTLAVIQKTTRTMITPTQTRKGNFKDGVDGKIISESVHLKPKMYCMEILGKDEPEIKRRAKGIPTKAINKRYGINEYRKHYMKISRNT